VGIRVRGRREIKVRGKTVSFAVCVFKTKSNISGKGLGEFQMEMERGRGLGGEDR
jgi:hypothetical protein